MQGDIPFELVGAAARAVVLMERPIAEQEPGIVLAEQTKPITGQANGWPCEVRTDTEATDVTTSGYAFSVIKQAKQTGCRRRPWLAGLLAPPSSKVAATAPANKAARPLWAELGLSCLASGCLGLSWGGGGGDYRARPSPGKGPERVNRAARTCK